MNHDRPKTQIFLIEKGTKAKLVYYPKLGPKLEMDCTIVAEKHPDYWIDTEHQKHVKVNRKDLEV